MKNRGIVVFSIPDSGYSEQALSDRSVKGFQVVSEGEPVTHSVDIYQRKEETLSPNSMQKRFSTDFRFRIAMVHFLDDSMIASHTAFMAASSSGNIL